MVAVVSIWRKPGPPIGLKEAAVAFSLGGERAVRERLRRIKSPYYRSQLEIKTISWLFDFIRANVKRGRVFELPEVLRTGVADCLGYCKLFTLLGRSLGLDAGVVEVLVDNMGRYVPHTAVLVRLSNQRTRFVDLWYGSKNIKHRRLGLRIKQDGAWKIGDKNLAELEDVEEVSYLPDSCVDAITLYIQGNRHLKKKDFALAIRYYSRAIQLYPGNARFLYNRAIAYENIGERDRARADYTRALSDERAVTRILAREHDEVTSLIHLDVKGMDEMAQQIYLLRHGFITGKGVSLARIARIFHKSQAEVASIRSGVEAKLPAPE